jgi:hypothetical protein
VCLDHDPDRQVRRAPDEVHPSPARTRSSPRTPGASRSEAAGQGLWPSGNEWSGVSYKDDADVSLPRARATRWFSATTRQVPVSRIGPPGSPARASAVNRYGPVTLLV